MSDWGVWETNRTGDGDPGRVGNTSEERRRGGRGGGSIALRDRGRFDL